MGFHGLSVQTEGVALFAATIVAWPFTRRATGNLVALLASLVGLGVAIVLGDFGPGIAMAIVGPALFLRSRAKKVVKPANLDVLREAVFVLTGFGLYELTRIAVGDSAGEATANANNLVSFERRIGIFSEREFQEFMSGNDSIDRVLNFVYSHGFLSTCLAVLVWTFVVDRRLYKLLRDAMGISALLAVVTIALLPVAPPRLMPALGIADTVVRSGREHHFVNQYAAMPSLHVGWIALVGVAVAVGANGRRGMRLLGILPPVAMLVVVVATGNHYWVDGVVGTSYALTGIGISEGLKRSGASSRLRFLAASASSSLLIARRVVSRSRSTRFTTMTTVGLIVYLLTAQALEPGFTDFWGYLLLQAVATAGLLLAGEYMLAEEGGLSWQTHLFAVVCLFADTIGTDGNLYANIAEYDKLTHFLGAAAITSGLAEAFRVLPARGFGGPAARTRIFIAIGLGIAVGVGWEVYEYLGDVVFHTTRVQGSTDTALDLVFDTLGATAAGFLGWKRSTSFIGMERAFAVPASAASGAESPVKVACNKQLCENRAMLEDEPYAMLQKAWQISTRQAGLPAVEQRFQSAAGLALTRPARVVLTLLSEKGPLHVSDLAAAAGVDVSTMSRTLRHLGESGFVSREPGEDLRAVRISITRPGEEAVTRLLAAGQRILREVLAGWDAADRDELSRLLCAC